MEEAKSKIISEIETGENVVSVKEPFKLYKDQSRRYIRLEISEPISYTILRDPENGLRSKHDEQVYNGSILNITDGGVLITGETPLEEGSLLVLKMTLQEIESLDQIVGLVKRADADGDEWLIGVEFITRGYLVDHLSSAELEMIPSDIASFDEQLKKTLNKYVEYNRSHVVSHR
jgi:hypothetical protein